MSQSPKVVPPPRLEPVRMVFVDSRDCAICSAGKSPKLLALDGASAPFSVLGISHHNAPIELRGRLAVSNDLLAEKLQGARAFGLTECVLLSTCNRTEFYFSGTGSDLAAEWMSETFSVDLSELAPYLYGSSCVCAACHLFRVTSGLDSAVLGESEIVAQVKNAWSASRSAGTSGPMVDLFFQRALEASKRVRTETTLCRTQTSTASLAVREAQRRVGDLAKKSIVLLGAGQMAERLAREFKSLGADQVVVINRTETHAVALAEVHGFTSRPIEQLDQVVAEADVVFATTSAADPVLRAEQLNRTQKPLAIFDLGVPANVENGVTSEWVSIVGIDTLNATCQENAELRASAIPHANAVLEEELARIAMALTERASGPTIKALVERGNAIRQRNIQWAKERLPELDEKSMRIVEEMAKRMAIGFLEAPIEGLKSHLHSDEHRELIERLFALNEVANDL